MQTGGRILLRACRPLAGAGLEAGVAATSHVAAAAATAGATTAVSPPTCAAATAVRTVITTTRTATTAMIATTASIPTSDNNRAKNSLARAPFCSLAPTSPSQQQQQQQQPPKQQQQQQSATAAELLAPLLEGKPFAIVQLPARGRGLVAVRHIPAGEEVHRERPLLVFPDLGATHQVCYHCLAAMPPGTPGAVRYGPTGRRFCCESCLAAALKQYHAVEAAAWRAAASEDPVYDADRATGAGCSSGGGGSHHQHHQHSARQPAPSGGGHGGGGGGGGALGALYEQCRGAGERFPLMTARVAFTQLTQALREHMQQQQGQQQQDPASSSSSSSRSSALNTASSTQQEQQQQQQQQPLHADPQPAAAATAQPSAAAPETPHSAAQDNSSNS
ncbi:hypothetical protein Agub_g8353, partial [Astrephomene gubernaculifera]